MFDLHSTCHLRPHDMYIFNTIQQHGNLREDFLVFKGSFLVYSALQLLSSEYFHCFLDLVFCVNIYYVHLVFSLGMYH